ncbi:hypothetical protein LIA77_05542 [Sarocladium implicatum]|nr:hypothetical protein LIA77_05542 [Sarocladium implicatum]
MLIRSRQPHASHVALVQHITSHLVGSCRRSQAGLQYRPRLVIRISACPTWVCSPRLSGQRQDGPVARFGTPRPRHWRVHTTKRLVPNHFDDPSFALLSADLIQTMRRLWAFATRCLNDEGNIACVTLCAAFWLGASRLIQPAAKSVPDLETENPVLVY